jgi:hypothetical protein
MLAPSYRATASAVVVADDDDDDDDAVSEGEAGEDLAEVTRLRSESERLKRILEGAQVTNDYLQHELESLAQMSQLMVRRRLDPNSARTRAQR